MEWKKLFNNFKKNTNFSENKLNDIELFIINSNLDDVQKCQVITLLITIYQESQSSKF